MSSSSHTATAQVANDGQKANDPRSTGDVPTMPNDQSAADVAAEAAPVETPVAAAAMKDITFDALKFDIKAGDAFERSMLARETEALNHKPIRIRGYIHPLFAYTDTLTRFVFTRDSDTCCFGPNLVLCDFIVVQMNPGKTANYSLYPVTVEGVFSIEESVDPADPDRAVNAIYRLDAESVR